MKVMTFLFKVCCCIFLIISITGNPIIKKKNHLYGGYSAYGRKNDPYLRGDGDRHGGLLASHFGGHHGGRHHGGMGGN